MAAALDQQQPFALETPMGINRAREPFFAQTTQIRSPNTCRSITSSTCSLPLRLGPHVGLPSATPPPTSSPATAAPGYKSSIRWAGRLRSARRPTPSPRPAPRKTTRGTHRHFKRQLTAPASHADPRGGHHRRNTSPGPMDFSQTLQLHG